MDFHLACPCSHPWIPFPPSLPISAYLPLALVGLPLIVHLGPATLVGRISVPLDTGLDMLPSRAPLSRQFHRGAGIAPLRYERGRYCLWKFFGPGPCILSKTMEGS